MVSHRMEHDDIWWDVLVLEKEMVEKVEAAMIDLCMIQEVNTLVQPRVITWDDMKKVTEDDSMYSELVLALGGNGPWSEMAAVVNQYKEHLSIIDGVVIFKGRSIVPLALQQQVLECLHSRHQGVKSMELRAQECVWWPWIYQDIQEVRDNCRKCMRDAPSQASAPPEDLPTIKSPFQQICGDYMQVYGFHYIVVVNQFSD